jgi:hypothetical protein
MNACYRDGKLAAVIEAIRLLARKRGIRRIMNLPLVAAMAEALAGIAAAVAIVIGLLEFRHRQRDQLDDRIAELLGVSLTYTLLKPRRSEGQNGSGRFSYAFTIHNPGRLPINRVSVRIRYPGPVRRVHSDLARTVEPETDSYEMYVASVAAGGQFTWNRELDVPVGVWEKMRSTTARISFRTPDVGEFVTTWPEAQELPSNSLLARLDALHLREQHQAARSRPTVAGATAER